MDTTSRAPTHGKLKVRYSPFVLFVVGVVEITAMGYCSYGFAGIIDARFGTNMPHPTLRTPRHAVKEAPRICVVS